jgi:hypothetical protein
VSLTALKWADIDFSAGKIRLTRAIVSQHVGSVKTETSQKPVPIDAGLSMCCWTGVAAALTIKIAITFSQFAEKKGNQPLRPSSAMPKHIRPAAERADQETRSLARL